MTASTASNPTMKLDRTDDGGYDVLRDGAPIGRVFRSPMAAHRDQPWTAEPLGTDLQLTARTRADAVALLDERVAEPHRHGLILGRPVVCSECPPSARTATVESNAYGGLDLRGPRGMVRTSQVRGAWAIRIFDHGPTEHWSVTFDGPRRDYQGVWEATLHAMAGQVGLTWDDTVGWYA